MKKIVFVTTNPHKLREAQLVLSECGIAVEGADVPKLELQAGDLETVALHAAASAYAILRRPLVVEDAGLFIEALGGFPGPYSSYVYKTIGLRGVLRLLEGVDDRRAYFKSVVAFAWEGGVKLFTGVVRGRIASEARGSGGFGFDPIFVPEGHDKTFAEMSIEEKCRVSHRARAFRELCMWLKRQDL